MGDKPIIAVIGGTGHEGGGIAARLAHAGYPVLIGSRDTARAAMAAEELSVAVGGGHIGSGDNAAVTDAASIVVLAVPYSGQQTTALGLIDQLRGKILIDATVPLMPPKVGRVQLPAGGSAVAALQEKLGESVKVVSAFQNVSWTHLREIGHNVDCDVIVCGDDRSACDAVVVLVEAIGMRGFHGGPVANSAAAEALTSVLISINRKYQSPGAGIRITAV